MKKIAAFDIGSNAVRMARASVSNEGEFNFYARERQPLRLGTEAFTQGYFSEHTMQEFERVFLEFKKLMNHDGIESYRAVATSAYRNARNSEELGVRVFEKTGIRIDCIDGQEEAALIRKAIQTQIDLNAKNYLLFDIGGGSAELTYLERGKPKGSISLPMGTVRLLEIGKRAEKDGLGAELGYRTYLSELGPQIKDFLHDVYGETKPLRIVGTGGNFKRLSRLRKRILGKKNIRYILPDEVAVIREALEDTAYLNRMKKFGLRHDRADVIIPAIYIIEKVMGYIPVKKIIAPDIGLIHGLLHDLAYPHEQSSSSSLL